MCHKTLLMHVMNIVVLGLCDCTTGAEPTDVKSFLQSLEVVTRTGDFDRAATMLITADVDALYRNSYPPRRGDEPKREKVAFIAYAEDTILVPGIPIDLETRVLKSRAILEVPGTGDDVSIEDQELRNRWFEAVANFALKMNSRIYRGAVEAKEIPPLPLSADRVRSILHIEQDVWAQLPVEVQVTLELLTNSKYSDVDLKSGDRHLHDE